MSSFLRFLVVLFLIVEPLAHAVIVRIERALAIKGATRLEWKNSGNPTLISDSTESDHPGYMVWQRFEIRSLKSKCEEIEYEINKLMVPIGLSGKVSSLFTYYCDKPVNPKFVTGVIYYFPYERKFDAALEDLKLEIEKRQIFGRKINLIAVKNIVMVTSLTFYFAKNGSSGQSVPPPEENNVSDLEESKEYYNRVHVEQTWEKAVNKFGRSWGAAISNEVEKEFLNTLESYVNNNEFETVKSTDLATAKAVEVRAHFHFVLSDNRVYPLDHLYASYVRDCRFKKCL